MIRAEDIREAINTLIKDENDKVAMTAWLSAMENEDDKERVQAGVGNH